MQLRNRRLQMVSACRFPSFQYRFFVIFKEFFQAFQYILRRALYFILMKVSGNFISEDLRD